MINANFQENILEKKSTNNNMICIKDFKGKSSFNIVLEPQYIDTQKFIDNLKKDGSQNYFEWTDYKSLVKPFYDIDEGYNTKEEFDEILEERTEELITKLSVKFPLGNIAITKSHGWKIKEYTENKVKKTKKQYALSFHFVINNYECNILELRKWNEENNMYNWLKTDKGVYRNGGNMRAIYSTKPKDKRIKEPENYKNNPEKHIIQSNSITNEYFHKLEFKNKIIDSPKKSPAISPPSSEEDDLIIVEKEEEKKEYPPLKFEELCETLLSIKHKWLYYADIIPVSMAFFNECKKMDELDDGFSIISKWIKDGEEIWRSRPDRSVENWNDRIKQEWKYWRKRQDNGCENKLTYGSLKKWAKETAQENKEMAINYCDKSENKFKTMFFLNMKYNDKSEEWEGKENLEGLTDLINKELMRTKKNEYIKIENEKEHYLMNKKDTIDEYAKYSFTCNKKEYNPFNLWLKNIKRRDIIGLKFDPSMKEDKNYFNIYKGFQYKLTDDNDYSKIEAYLYHIKDVWANGNETTYNYILNWFAHIYQKPNEKTLVALVIPSKTQGNGKNIALKAHSEIMESLYFSTAQIDQIVGTFNPSAEGRLLINLNECTWAGRKSQSGILKALISEDTMTINNKNVKPYTIENYSNIIITSNDENPVEIEQKDRRYFVLDIKEEKLSDERTKAILKTDNQVLFNFFMNRDISDFKPTEFIKTGKEQEMKEFSFDTDFMFWKNCLQNNFIEDNENSFSFDEIEKDYQNKLLKTFVIKAYNNMNYGYKTKMSDNIFWKNTKKIFPNLKLLNADKKHKPRCEFYNIDIMKKDFNNYFEGNYI